MGVTSLVMQFTIVDLLSKGIDNIKSRLTSLSSTSKDVQKSFDNMTRSFKYAAMSGIATREIYKGMKPAITLAGDLQAEMLGVSAELMGAGKSAQTLNGELKNIKATAFSVQAWTPFDMTQIVALEKELIKAGASIEDVTGKTGAAAATAALAVYENLDPVSTGKALIGIGTPFKITADKYMELADAISRAASASTVGAAEIAETAKYAAGPMAQVGRSSEEMLALSAVMAQVGIDGSMAGTSLKNFFLEAGKHTIFRDAKGNLLPTIKIIEILRQKLEGMGNAKQQEVLKKLFGEQGMPVAMAMLNKGKGSYEEIMKAMKDSASLQDKLNKSMEGFSKQLTSLRGTFKSTIADLFQPALPILTSLIKKTNDFVAAIGTASQKSETAGKAVSGISMGALAAGGLATIALGGAGLYYGRKTLKGVGGVKGLLSRGGSLAGGIAEGKAVQAATGVNPVFVTNWPANIGGSVAATAADMAGGLAGKAGALKKLVSMGSLVVGGKLALAGAVGYASYKASSAVFDATGLTKVFERVGEKLYDILNPEEAAALKGQEVKNKIDITLTDNRTVVKADNMNTEANITVPRTKL